MKFQCYILLSLISFETTIKFIHFMKSQVWNNTQMKLFYSVYETFELDLIFRAFLRILWKKGPSNFIKFVSEVAELVDKFLQNNVCFSVKKQKQSKSYQWWCVVSTLVRVTPASSTAFSTCNIINYLYIHSRSALF